MKKITIYFLSVLTVVSLSCQRERSEVFTTCVQSSQTPSGYQSSDFVEVNYNQNHCGYLPLGKKNYWIYLDSSFSASGQFQNSFLDTVRFTKTFRTPDGIIWWSTDGPQSVVSLAGYPKYNYSTDSIVYGTTIYHVGMAGCKWFYSIGNSSLQSENISYSDLSSPCYAQRITTSVQVPAGSFSDCTFFNKKLVYGTGIELSTWFKPGVGVLRTDMFLGSRVSTAWLISYHIE